MAMSIQGFMIRASDRREGFLCDSSGSLVFRFSVFNTEDTEKSHRGHREPKTAIKWCRGGELNSLRRPFQGRALPVSYPGTGAVKDSTGALLGCQLRNGFLPC